MDSGCDNAIPESFPGLLGESLIGSALAKKLWTLQTVNLRDYGIGPHKG